MAGKKKKKRPVPRKKTARKRAAKHAKRTPRRAPKRTVKRKKKRPASRPKRRKAKGRKAASAKRKVGRKVKRKVRRKVGRKVRRKVTRKAARKRPKAAVRKKKKPARRKASAKSRPVRKSRAAKRRPAAKRVRKPARRRPAVKKSKKPVRRFPRAPTTVARKPARGLSLRKLAARLTPLIKPPIEAYSGNKPYIFASYSHKNIREVFWCIKKLAESRYRIWYDEGIEPGNEWPEEVGRALTGCQLFLVFMSQAAMDSRNVRNEINFASSENKSMMVVFLQPAQLSEGMQLQIGTVQFIHKNELTDTEFLEKMKKVLDPALRT